MVKEYPNDVQPLQIREVKEGSERLPDVDWIRRVGDYFVIGSEPDSKKNRLIYVYSSDGKRVRLILTTANLLMEVRKHIRPDQNKDRIQGLKGRDPFAFSITSLPEPLQKIALTLEPKLADDIYKDNSLFPQSYLLADSFPSEEIVGGRFLVCSNKQKLFAIQVKNEGGFLLPQDQWIIYTSLTPDEQLPPELKKWRDESETNERYISLTASFDGSVSSGGLKIYKVGDRTSVVFTESSITDKDGNFVVSSSSPPILYFIPHDHPTEVKLIVMDTDPSRWQVRSAQFSTNNKYTKISSLNLDPTGNFFIFESEKNVHIITTDTLEQVGKIPDVGKPSIDSSGLLSVVKTTTVVSFEFKTPEEPFRDFKFYNIDFTSFAQKRRVAQQQRIAQGLSADDLFMSEAERVAANTIQKAQEMQPIIDAVMPAFEQRATAIRQSKDVSEIETLETALDNLRDQLHIQMPGQKASIDTIVDTIRLNVIEPLRRVLYKDEAEKLLTRVQTDVQGRLSLSVINFLNQDYQRLSAMMPSLDDSQRQQIVFIGRELQKKTSEFMSVHSDEFIQQAESIIKGADQKLQTFTSKAEMDDWMEYEMPAIVRNLGILFQQCPPEATTALASITKSRRNLAELADAYEKKFKREYATIREKAAGKTEEIGRLITEDTHRLLERVKDKQFTSRKDAENYVASSQTYKQILDDIDILKQKDPDKGRAIYQHLEVMLSNLYYAIDRNSGKQISNTGQQIVFFGETKFPIWEGKVKQRGQRKADVVFIADKSTHGPGVTADKILGDISIKIKDGEGRESIVRLFQELEDENEYRYGFQEKRGEQIPPSYLTGEDYRKFKKDLADWEKGIERSLIYKEYLARRQKLRVLYATRPKGDQSGKETWDALHKEEYKKLLKEYAQYCREHNVSLLRKIDRVKNTSDVEHVNGKGYIPEWQSHWVVDPQTDHYLEEMAQLLKMQSELQEGMLLLKGHAGTGKDVLVKMFCEKTHRPYFAIDCTKWTTEFELSEDIVLESVNGASQTIKVPSVVLNAITTPGSVMYFNELNAMPEQAQIFLHSLLDEKRSLTLKTSSGKTIKADPSVLIIGSMNPGYPGTFDPQFATRSRTVSINVDYPSLTREPDKTDPNQKTKPISVSEALRMARGIASLQDMTYEMDFSRNMFVKIWDKYVNHIDTGAPEPTTEQKFDIDTILALVQFGNELREHFIAIFENQKKTKSGTKVLEVRQPVTSREMRRAAYSLSKMTPTEKAAKNPDDTARDLLRRFFLSHIDDTEVRKKIELHLTNMHSQKRLAQ